MFSEWVQRDVRRSDAEHHCVAHEEELFPRQPMDIAQQGLIWMQFLECFVRQQYKCEAEVIRQNFGYEKIA